MILTREYLEGIIPAFQSPDNYFVDTLQTPYDEAYQQLHKVYTNMYQDHAYNFADLGALQTYVDESQVLHTMALLLGVLRVLPSLDLVATPTGFGIVSNEHVAPASRERVDTLTRNLFIRYVQLYQTFTFSLHLLGVRPYGFFAVFKEDLLDEAPLPFLPSWAIVSKYADTAEEALRTAISPELYESLLADGTPLAYLRSYHQVDPDLPRCELAERRLSTGVQKVLKAARSYYNAMLVLADEKGRNSVEADDYNRVVVISMRRTLKRTLLQTPLEPALAPYLLSNTAKADTFRPHENKADDPTFFFG